MGAMNFFRALASAFVVAIMGAIMLAASRRRAAARRRGGVGVRRGAHDSVAVADLARTFSHIFAVAAVFLVIGIIALIVMEERPLRTTVLAVPATRRTPPRAPAE